MVLALAIGEGERVEGLGRWARGPRCPRHVLACEVADDLGIAVHTGDEVPFLNVRFDISVPLLELSRVGTWKYWVHPANRPRDSVEDADLEVFEGACPNEGVCL